MQDDENLAIPRPNRAPWNKGKLIGAKPPLRQKHIFGNSHPCYELSRLNVTSRCSILPSTVSCSGAAT